MSVFRCPGCGKTITVTFLSPGEVAKCKACGAEVKVPEENEEPVLVSRAEQEPDEGVTSITSHTDKTIGEGGRPAVRFHALRSVALAYKTVAGIVALVTALCAIGIAILASDYDILAGILLAFVIAMAGGPAVVILLSLGDVIMVHISIEENTRATLQLLQRHESRF